MSVRLTGALVAALALLAALPAGAAAQLSSSAQRVYDDYRSDAAIRPCDHSVKLYRRTLRQITPDIEEETPAFRPAVEAALRDRRGRDVRRPGRRGPGHGRDAGRAGDAAGHAPGRDARARAAEPGPGAARQPAQPAQPAPTQPEAQATPAPTPTPTVAPAPPVTSSSPAPATDPVLVDRPHEGTPVGLLIALGLLALALLAVLLGLAARRFGWFPGARHAWGEAAYRAGGTWTDFVDWARLRR